MVPGLLFLCSASVMPERNTVRMHRMLLGRIQRNLRKYLPGRNPRSMPEKRMFARPFGILFVVTTAAMLTAPCRAAAQPSPASSMPVLYDDDGSLDGLVALLFMLADPEIDVRAVCISYGEAHPEMYATKLSGLMHSLNLGHIPVGFGRDTPLEGNNAFPSWLRDLSDSFWGMPTGPDSASNIHEAVELICRTLNNSARPVTVFVSGASTNIAEALRRDPGIAGRIGRVFMMGGAIRAPGNIDKLVPGADNRVAEWNIYVDPHAAAEVFASGLDIFLVPLDATNKVLFDRRDFHAWREHGTKMGEIAADRMEWSIDRRSAGKTYIWDLVAAAIMARSGEHSFEMLEVEVVTSKGALQGQIRVHPGARGIHSCVDPDVELIKKTVLEAFSGIPE
ncbi:MAG: nucleoside hydrolase [Chitinivibrionales bacterium]|nr:nucleoside hydrolase [Chitinivibrionales bacterium]MBD3394978.1 nucleoside hydrolase [Chitinivibrionales bacterium]